MANDLVGDKKMNKKYWLLATLFFCFSFISSPAYSKTAIIGPLTSYIGGVAGALDSVECDDILGDNTNRAIATGDIAIVAPPIGDVTFHRYVSTGSDSESSPMIIVPDDRADCAGTGQWNLVAKEFKTKSFTNGAAQATFTEADMMPIAR